MTIPEPPPPTIVPASVDRAIRISFCVLSLLFSYFAVYLAMRIGSFGAVFSDMLGGRLLPSATQFVLQTAPFWVILSAICAILPFGFAFLVKRTSFALYGIATATAVQLIQAIFLWKVLTAPLVAIIHGMSGAQ